MLTAAEAWRMLDERSSSARAEEVEGAIRRVAGEITAQLRDAYPLVLASWAARVVFAGQLLPLLRFPLDFDYVHVTRYGDDTTRRRGALEGRAGRRRARARGAGARRHPRRGRHAGGDPRRLLGRGAAVLQGRRARRQGSSRDAKPIRPDFVGLRIPDRFVFGCGMDVYGLLAQPAGDLRVEASLDAGDHRRQRPHPAREPRRHRAQGGAHAVRRALGRAHVRDPARPEGGVSRAPRLRPHHPPHEVNYRANIWALREEGATEIVSVASVGGIRADLGPGALVVPHQIIDYTWGRRSTFFEGGDVPVTHIDFTRRTRSVAPEAPRGGRARAASGRRRRRLRRDAGSAARDRRRDRPPGARRRGHRRHDRHAGSRARARARPRLRGDRGGRQPRRRARREPRAASGSRTSSRCCRPPSAGRGGSSKRWRSSNDPRRAADGRSAPARAGAAGGALRHAGAARAARRHARHDGAPQRRRARRAADRRAAAGGDLRRRSAIRAIPTPSRCPTPC